MENIVYRKKLKKSEYSRSVVLLNVDTCHIEICFCCNEKLFFSRCIPYGGEHLLSGHRDELVKQIRLSLRMYEGKRLGPPVEEILILGAPNEGKILKKCLEGVVPVTSLDPSDGIEDFPGMDKADLKNPIWNESTDVKQESSSDS